MTNADWLVLFIAVLVMSFSLAGATFLPPVSLGWSPARRVHERFGPKGARLFYLLIATTMLVVSVTLVSSSWNRPR